ncbi:SurA N-terminal domain-containing protein [Candidatus Bipolaricaulota bacterium]|nr:SurA N-terminal domain-containing protein [Candidatus Bipolaricaulota bacterium]
MNFSKKGILVFALALLLVTPSFALLAQEGSEGNQSNQQTVVATVNGEEITDQQLSQSAQVYQIIMTLSQQFRNFAQFMMTSEAGNNFLTEYRKYVLDRMIEQKLQDQKMEELGIQVSKEDVQAEIDGIISNNDQFESEQDLEDYLKNNQNSNLDNLKSQIRGSLRREKLREEVTGEVNVTDEEISSYYEQNKGNYTDQEGNVKPLEEVRDQITQTLKGQKRNEQWNNWLEEAKEEAEIEKKEENL